MITEDVFEPSSAPAMSSATPQRKQLNVRSTTWDKDFIFSQEDAETRKRSMSKTPKHSKNGSLQEHMDKGNDGSPYTPQRNVVDGLRAWSESPTSPRLRGTSGARRVGRHEDRENWDEDFLDSTDSPVKPSAPTSVGRNHRSVQRSRAPEPEEENWDEDFEMGLQTSTSVAGLSKNSKRSRRERNAAWDSSDDDMDDFDREFGFGRNDEEDKTVTSRSRRKPLSSLSNDVASLPSISIPPLPALPNFLPTIPSGDGPEPPASPSSPFPRSSPSHSVFSIPATTNSGHRDRDSAYGSTAHLALSLRRTHSAESSPSSLLHQKFIDRSRFPQGSEAPRERRRLRKKSRPPHLDSSILELDDRAGPEPTLGQPLTPDSRPSTPPPPPSSTGPIMSPVTPSSAVPSSSAPPVPMSPTSASKSPLLARLGSMRRWGRKRPSIGTGGEAGSPDASTAPATLVSRTQDVEADRLDNNRTPRPRSQFVPQEPPLSTLPPAPSASQNRSMDLPQTPSRNRFFRGPSGGMGSSSAATSSTRAVDKAEVVNRTTSDGRDQERLRVMIPSTVPLTAQSSQSGESEVGISASPRRTRIRTFGQKLLSSNRSASASSDRGKESSDGDSCRASMYAIGHRQVSTPLSGETPTRLRPRIPGSHQAPSSLGKTRPVFPRHASGSALNDNDPHIPPALSLGTSGRSVSATGSSGTGASSDDLSHHDRGTEDKSGYRGFMGSLRRISLVTAQAQHRAQHSANSHSRTQSPVPAVPPLPFDRPERDSGEKMFSRSLPKVFTEDPAAALRTSVSGVIQVDLASPTSSPLDDWPSSVPPRRSGDVPVLSHSKSSSFATSPSQAQNASLSQLNSVSQAASLGRASPLLIGTESSGNLAANGNSNVHRRSSLGDLKIPSRISRAQDGLKRDLGRVREFAGRVEQMQELRSTYLMIALQIQSILDPPRPPSRATSPTSGRFSLSRSNSRARSNTNPPPPPSIDYRGLALSFKEIDAKYSVAWECADLLIELGTGNVADSSAQGAAAPSAGGPDAEPVGRGKNRERAVTLAGDEGKPDLSMNEVAGPKIPPAESPPAILSWRASTGRHDMGHRQLHLLKEMLNNAKLTREGAQLDLPDFLSTPQWSVTDEAMESTFTLPTEESVVTNPTLGSYTRKKWSGSKLGMVGIRDMLRSLKRSTARALQKQSDTVVAHSSSTLSTDLSFDSNLRRVEHHPYGYNTVSGIPMQSLGSRRKSETSASLIDSMRSPAPENLPYNGRLPLAHKASPRRPSLASLFRLGQKHKAGAAMSSAESPAQSSAKSDATLDISSRTDVDGKDREDTSQEISYDDIEDSDWDRMDSMSDVDVQLAAIGDQSQGQGSTMKLRKKKQQHRLSMPPSSRPLTPKHPFSSSQGSFASPDQSSMNVRTARLSNVDENKVSVPSSASRRATPESTRRPRSRSGKNRDREKQFSSVHAASHKANKAIPSFDGPPVPALHQAPSLKLAMTPENIRPLLENARVVTVRLHDCLAEVKGLLVRTEGSSFTFSVSASSSNVAL